MFKTDSWIGRSPKTGIPEPASMSFIQNQDLLQEVEMKCKIEGCSKETKTKKFCYCNKHYRQILKFGVVKRTFLDPNEFIFEGNFCRIKLYNRQGDGIAEAIINIKDYEKVKDYKWGLHDGRVRCTTLKKYLHQVIVGTIDEGMEIDHKNLNQLDNRKCNLRVAKRAQNVWNTKLRLTNTSGFKGISFHKYSGLWHSRIMVEGKTISLGYYKNKIEAAKAYDEAVLKYHGEFALTNAMLGLL